VASFSLTASRGRSCLKSGSSVVACESDCPIADGVDAHSVCRPEALVVDRSRSERNVRRGVAHWARSVSSNTSVWRAAHHWSSVCSELLDKFLLQRSIHRRPELDASMFVGRSRHPCRSSGMRALLRNELLPQGLVAGHA
jgi:hypothetical protein